MLRSDGNKVTLVFLPYKQCRFVEYDVAALEGLTLTGEIIHTGPRYADNANTLKVKR